MEGAALLPEGDPVLLPRHGADGRVRRVDGRAPQADGSTLRALAGRVWERVQAVGTCLPEDEVLRDGTGAALPSTEPGIRVTYMLTAWTSTMDPAGGARLFASGRAAYAW